MSDVRLDDQGYAEASADRLSEAYRSEAISRTGRWLLRKGIVKSPRAANMLIVAVSIVLLVISLFFWF